MAKGAEKCSLCMLSRHVVHLEILKWTRMRESSPSILKLDKSHLRNLRANLNITTLSAEPVRGFWWRFEANTFKMVPLTSIANYGCIKMNINFTDWTVPTTPSVHLYKFCILVMLKLALKFLKWHKLLSNFKIEGLDSLFRVHFKIPKWTTCLDNIHGEHFSAPLAIFLHKMCWPQSATKIHVLAMQTVLYNKGK
jgi:hypothetical protein